MFRGITGELGHSPELSCAQYFLKEVFYFAVLGQERVLSFLTLKLPSKKQISGLYNEGLDFNFISLSSEVLLPCVLLRLRL